MDYLRGKSLVVLTRYIEPKNGPADALAKNYIAVRCSDAGFELRDDVAVNAVAIRFKHRGPTPPHVVQYVGVVDEVGRLLSTLRASKREPDASGDVVFEAGDFRVMNE